MSNGQVTGLEVCLANVRKIEKAFEAEGKKALDKWGGDTINESKDNFCPVDSGEMKATGGHKVTKEGSTLWVTLYYNTDYAPTVHEKPASHPIGQSGFLRVPFNQRVPKLATDLIEGIGKAVK